MPTNAFPSSVPWLETDTPIHWSFLSSSERGAVTNTEQEIYKYFTIFQDSLNEAIYSIRIHLLSQSKHLHNIPQCTHPVDT